MKKCIVHIPYKIDEHAKAAPMMRPRKMIEAFSNIGYEVEVVSGNSSERKKIINNLKKYIENGVKYDFMYSESSTMPTVLTDKHHIPFHPFFDFDFFEYLFDHGIKIGLFYRDIYWKFEDYKKAVSWWKAWVAIWWYKYDLKKYGEFLTRLYVASERCFKYLKEFDGCDMLDVLPPGTNIVSEKFNKKYYKNILLNKKLTVFYVGGLGYHYQIKELMIAINRVTNCRLILCCRKNEFEKEFSNLQDALTSNIEIVHAEGAYLEEYYIQSDICSIMFKKDIYREMAIPYKSFEYLSYLKPVIATKGTAIGDFVEKNDIGWSLEYKSDDIARLLQEIIDGKINLSSKIENCVKVREENTWENRARKVVRDLCI